MDEVKAASSVQHPNLLEFKGCGEGTLTNTRG